LSSLVAHQLLPNYSTIAHGMIAGSAQHEGPDVVSQAITLSSIVSTPELFPRAWPDIASQAGRTRLLTFADAIRGGARPPRLLGERYRAVPITAGRPTRPDPAASSIDHLTPRGC